MLPYEMGRACLGLSMGLSDLCEAIARRATAQAALDRPKQAKDNCNQALGQAEPAPKLIQDQSGFNFACALERRPLPQDRQGQRRSMTPFGAGCACPKALVDCENVCSRPSRAASLKPIDCPNQTALTSR
jgi:hypothetical protein